MSTDSADDDRCPLLTLRPIDDGTDRADRDPAECVLTEVRHPAGDADGAGGAAHGVLDREQESDVR